MNDSKRIAQGKIEKALVKLEQAQVMLGEACAELCPLVGMIDEWEHIGRLYDQVKAGWHLVNQGRYRQEIDLDSESKTKQKGLL